MMNGRLEADKAAVQAQNRGIEDQIQGVDSTNDNMHRLLIEELEGLPNKAALVEVLREISQQNPCLPLPKLDNESQMIRLDNMLASEGISPDSPIPITFPNIGETPGEQHEYQEKVLIFRKLYQEELANYEKACQEFKEPVISLLEQQSSLRPVSDIEKEILLANIQQRFQGIQLQLKESMCQAILMLRSRFFDARRKRRNFSKTATVILNEYFYNNLSNPYPSDLAKEDLAVKCNLTVAQVANWFGNKRIRYKKHFGKSEEDIKMEQSDEQVTSELQSAINHHMDQ